MKQIRLLFFIMVAGGLFMPVLAQQPTSVSGFADHILLQIEGPLPRWDITETEKQLRLIFSEEEFDEFLRSIERLRVWHDESSSVMLQRYISRIQAGQDSQPVRDLVSSLVQLQELISPASVTPQPYTPPPPVISAAPQGVTVTGRIRSRIEGNWNPGFAGGLVFALSADREQIFGFSYTTDTAFRDGYFQIDGLPKHGNIVLVAFAPTVKRLHWIDTFSLDHLAGSEAVHQRMDIGTVYATLTVPSAGSPHDLSGSGAVVLQGKTAALQLLALAGWLADRRLLPDYTQIDELTNRLYGYYTDGIENHIQKDQPAQISHVAHLPPVQFNVPYIMEGPRPALFGFKFMMFDDAEKPACSQERAARFAADFFSPACNIDPASYRPYATVNLNRSGRLAYIFASCAGPQTRGTITYLIIERRMECKDIGNFSTIDPLPEFTIRMDEPEEFGGWMYERAVIYPMEIKAAGFLTRLEFNVNSQRYLHAGIRLLKHGEK